jgi:heterodisulfide reductase subunit C
MKYIIIISLISLSCISAFWYFEVATPYQKEFTQQKAGEYGFVVIEKSNEIGSTVAEKGKEVYENREEYIEKAKEIGSSISDKTKKSLDTLKYKIKQTSSNTETSESTSNKL